MPELPEIETLRRDLCGSILNKQIDLVVVTSPRSIRHHREVSQFVNPLLNGRIEDVLRKGKYLIFVVIKDSATISLVAHMGMSGQLQVVEVGAPLAKHSHIEIGFTDGLRLVFVDPRTFGQMYVDKLGEADVPPSLTKLGPDPLVDPEEILESLKGFRRSSIGVKWLLLDQSKICGIGNMYADEILFRSRIRFDRPGKSLDDLSLENIRNSITMVLGEAILARGSTLKDLQYRDLYGRTGQFQNSHYVYGREGQPCRICSGKIVRIFSKGRSSFFCDICQK
jgi:formamidopyrimidine-DNA glycosylase